MIQGAEILYLIGAGLVFITGAGLYALLYAYGKIKANVLLQRSSYIFAVLMLLGVFYIVQHPAFDTFWKGLLLVCGFTYLFIPKSMLWVMERVHAKEEEERKKEKHNPFYMNY